MMKCSCLECMEVSSALLATGRQSSANMLTFLHPVDGCLAHG